MVLLEWSSSVLCRLIGEEPGASFGSRITLRALVCVHRYNHFVQWCSAHSSWKAQIRNVSYNKLCITILQLYIKTIKHWKDQLFKVQKIAAYRMQRTIHTWVLCIYQHCEGFFFNQISIFLSVFFLHECTKSHKITDKKIHSRILTCLDYPYSASGNDRPEKPCSVTSHKQCCCRCCCFFKNICSFIFFNSSEHPRCDTVFIKRCFAAPFLHLFSFFFYRALDKTEY